MEKKLMEVEIFSCGGCKDVALRMDRLFCHRKKRYIEMWIDAFPGWCPLPDAPRIEKGANDAAQETDPDL